MLVRSGPVPRRDGWAKGRSTPSLRGVPPKGYRLTPSRAETPPDGGRVDGVPRGRYRRCLASNTCVPTACRRLLSNATASTRARCSRCCSSSSHSLRRRSGLSGFPCSTTQRIQDGRVRCTSCRRGSPSASHTGRPSRRRRKRSRAGALRTDAARRALSSGVASVASRSTAAQSLLRMQLSRQWRTHSASASSTAFLEAPSRTPSVWRRDCLRSTSVISRRSRSSPAATASLTFT